MIPNTSWSIERRPKHVLFGGSLPNFTGSGGIAVGYRDFTVLNCARSWLMRTWTVSENAISLVPVPTIHMMILRWIRSWWENQVRNAVGYAKLSWRIGSVIGDVLSLLMLNITPRRCTKAYLKFPLRCCHYPLYLWKSLVECHNVCLFLWVAIMLLLDFTYY